MKLKKTIFFALAALFLGSLVFADVAVAPNPWIPEDGRQSTGNLAGGITFRDIPAESELLIYTVRGDLVRKIEFNNSTAVTKVWDGKDDDGSNAASGVYLWLIKSPSRNQKGKLIIIR